MLRATVQGTGTLGFIAPEVIQRGATQSSDMFALGGTISHVYPDDDADCKDLVRQLLANAPCSNTSSASSCSSPNTSTRSRGSYPNAAHVDERGQDRKQRGQDRKQRQARGSSSSGSSSNSSSGRSSRNSSYIGLARSAATAPIIKKCNTAKADGEIPELLLQMASEMVVDPRQNRVGLIHGEKLRLKHTSLQEQLIKELASYKVVVANHNSGHLGLGEDVESSHATYGMSLLATDIDGLSICLQDFFKNKKEGHQYFRGWSHPLEAPQVLQKC